jgi:hypothetical protein
VNPELLARDLAADDAAAATERAQTVPQARIVRALRLFGDALAAARNSGNARLELETAMLRFILQTEDPSLDALAARVTAIESGNPVVAPAPVRAAVPAPPRPVTPAPAPAAAPVAAPARVAVPPAPAPKAAAPQAQEPVPKAVVPSAPAAVAPVGALTPAKVRSLWSNVRTRAESEKPSLAASLGRATIDAVTDDSITLRTPDPISGETLKSSLATLKRAVDAVIGRPIELRVIVGAAPAPVASESAAGDEMPQEHPDDVARYAFDRLL